MIRDRKGTILIASLWILSILAMLAMGIGFRVSIEARLAKYNTDRQRALYLAKAGYVKAAYRLSKNPSPGCDTLFECGTAFTAQELSDPEKMKAIFSRSLGSGAFSVGYQDALGLFPGVSDEERRININTAPENVLKCLLEYIGEDPAIASGIVGWRSPGAGMDDGYYESLPSPYKCKHERFAAAEELMLVKGVSRKVFEKIKDYITVYGAPKFAVNINTAPKAVLCAVIMSDASSNPPIDRIGAEFSAGKIIELRNGPDRKAGTRDDNKFISAEAGLENITGGVLSATQAANLTKDFTITSAYFRIESQGTYGRAKVSKRIVCVVEKTQGKAPKLISYREY